MDLYVFIIFKIYLLAGSKKTAEGENEPSRENSSEFYIASAQIVCSQLVSFETLYTEIHQNSKSMHGKAMGKATSSCNDAFTLNHTNVHNCTVLSSRVMFN